MSRVLSIDLDGTLLDESNNIVGGEATLDMFKVLHAKGVQIVINTGRLDHDIDFIKNRYSLPIDVRISQNGAVTFKDDTLKAALLDKQEALQFYQAIIKTDLRVELNTISNRYWHSLRSPDFPKEFYDSSRVISDFTPIIQYQPCVLFLLIGNQDEIEGARSLVETNFKHLLAVQTSATSLEVLVRGVSKGKSLSEAFPESEIFAIGDSENDHSMFDCADHAYYVCHENYKNTQKVHSIAEALADIINVINNDR